MCEQLTKASLPLPSPPVQRETSSSSPSSATAPPVTSTINCAPFGVRRVTAVVHEPASDCLVLGSSFMSDPLAMLVSRSAGVLWRYRPAGDRGAVRAVDGEGEDGGEGGAGDRGAVRTLPATRRHCKRAFPTPVSLFPPPSPDVLYRCRRAHRCRPLPCRRRAARHPATRRRACHAAHGAALPALRRRR